jgi:hypothetical protein
LALNPEWTGERMRMMKSHPKNEALWEKYLVERQAGLRDEESPARGNAFYAAHRHAMDEGAEASWPARFRSDELSAIQSAMNLKLTDPHAYAAEYDNDPLDDESEALKPSLKRLCDRFNQLQRAVVPHWAKS